MRLLVLTLAAGGLLHGADERKLALETAAQADFDRVTTGPLVDLASTAKCLQSQAMLLAIATPGESPTVMFRKAYCALASAALSQNPTASGQAAEMFDTAITDAEATPAKQKVPLVVPPTWRILASIARLNSGAAAESQEQLLLRAVDADSSECQTSGGTGQFCHSVKQLGSAWLGWIALQRGDAIAAERRFTDANAPGWTEWAAGLRAFRNGNFANAARNYGGAITAWRSAGADSLARLLGPRPAMSEMLTDWAGAQLAANDAGGAIAQLDAAVKADSTNARALYLRGVAKQRLGRNDTALDDLNLAARAAFAKNGDAGAAEAHFYRGIALYWHKEFQRAENEFISALNADIATPWRADARGWLHLAAVGSGACGASRNALETAMASVSPYFPRTEARTALAACPVTAAALPIK